MSEQPETRPLRLLVVDDHEVVRQGLVSLLERRERFQVVAEAGTVEEAIEGARRHQPDLVVMDVRLPDGSGIEACREIRSELPGTRVVMLTSYPDEEAVLSAIIAGASGYLLKQIRSRDLIAALEAVGRARSSLDPAVARSRHGRVRAGSRPGPTPGRAGPMTRAKVSARRRGSEQREILRRSSTLGQNQSELRQLHPLEAGYPAPRPGRGVCREAPAAGFRDVGRRGGPPAASVRTAAPRGPDGRFAPRPAVPRLPA
jgi:DNA-binding NarL/FixJ family response regulator